MNKKSVIINFSNEEYKKVCDSALAHKMEVEEYIKGLINYSMTKNKHC
jgi:hypothetical protein